MADIDYHNDLSSYMLKFSELVAKPIVNMEILYENYYALLDEIFDMEHITFCILSYDQGLLNFNLRFLKNDDGINDNGAIAIKAAQTFMEKEMINCYSKEEMKGLIESDKFPETMLISYLALDSNITGALCMYTAKDSDLNMFAQHQKAFFVFISSVLSLAAHKKSYEKRINTLAYNDNLTSLPNRDQFRELLASAMQFSDITNTMLAMLMIDIDRFKNINDTLGYEIGDEVIIQIAKRLKSTVGTNGTVARFGGDDFAILVKDIDVIEYIYGLCEDIIAVTKNPMSIDKYLLTVTASIGVCIYPNDGGTVDELVRNADTALNEAKDVARNSYRFYKEEMTHSSQKKLFLINKLESAIKNDEFVMFYQGQLDIKDKKIRSVEALIRWKTEDRGILLPYDFIPFAEKNDQIVSIDKLVMRKVCAQLREWCDKGLNIQIGINISPDHFTQGNIVTSLNECIKEFGVDPKLVDVEILESALIENMEHTIEIIKMLKNIGVSVSLDDFGTGYSSLEYITTLPIDTLKIDRSFTMKMEENKSNKIVLKTIIGLAKEMNYKVIAEGVEKETHLEFLENIGCDMAQGYLINKPVCAEEMEKIIYSYE